MTKRVSIPENIILDNRYKLEKKIGSGGMADVYKGTDTLLERTVAIKVLHQNFASDAAFVNRFKGEAQAAGKLNHQHIVNMYDVGFDQGWHYIVMEYVPGKTLKEIIKQHGKLPIKDAVEIAIAIGEGLQQAHSIGIAHCDIKPHNILITETGNIKVTDFGIARAMNSSQTLMYATSVMGSAHYISPEQASGKSITGASDIYSLGVVLYEMVTGKVPFQGDSPIGVALKHLRENCPRPSKLNPNIPPNLENIILKALEKDANNRFDTIDEMISALKNFGKDSINSKNTAYDFATQIMPRIKNSKNAVKDDKSSEETFMDKLTNISQKYIIGGGLVLFLVTFLWAYFSFGNFWSNAVIEVPNVVGKQVSVATNILEDRDLKVSVTEVANSSTPPGEVISMSPEAGAEVKQQRIIKLIVSKGGGDISMPDLKGLSVEDAKNNLKILGINNISIERKDDSSLPNNAIVMQKPDPFAKVGKDVQVTIYVNQRVDKKVNIPQLVGLSVKDAKNIIKDLQLNAIFNGSENDDAIITEQMPTSGNEINEGGTIQLNASADQTGSNKVTGTVDITVPAGKNGQLVKIVVRDDNGQRVIYDNRQNPGDHIVRNISGNGTVRVLVYINGTLVQDQIL